MPESMFTRVLSALAKLKTFRLSALDSSADRPFRGAGLPCICSSQAVEMTFTLRNSDTGHPCDTAFSCIGWPFASLKDEPSLYVLFPPIIDNEFQKSGVRA